MYVEDGDGQICTGTQCQPDPHTSVTISQAERIRQVVDDIVLSDELGVDFYGVGENIIDQNLQFHRQRYITEITY